AVAPTDRPDSRRCGHGGDDNPGPTRAGRIRGAAVRTAVLTEYDAPLRVGELPDPRPGPGDVLVRVMASGVNPLDIKIRRGQAAHAQMAPPAVLGIDMAGVVEAVGAGVDRFRVGDEVFGMTG